MLLLIEILKAKLETVPEEGHFGGDEEGFEQTSSFDRFSVMFDKNAPYKRYKCQNFVKIVNVSAADLDDEELGGPLRTQARNDKERQSCWKDRETEVRSLINRPELEEGENRKKRLSDRDIFSHLCYRNFAHMAAVPFIQSIQRVTYMKGVPKSDIETKLETGEMFDNGVLWCITKMWSNEKNFDGHVLWKIYLKRLIGTLVIIGSFIFVWIRKGFLQMTLRAFEYEIGPEPMAEFCCSVDFGPQRPPMELLCTAPTAEDVPKLVFASICIVGLILFFTLKKIWEFYIFPNSHNMGAKFLSYTLDDPLSYCQYWQPTHRQRQAMAKASADLGCSPPNCDTN